MSVIPVRNCWRLRIPFARIPLFVALCLSWTVFSGTAEAGLKVPLNSVAQITVDDENNNLSYPSALFFDPVQEETYLVNGGTGRVIVYNADYFPAISIGTGRGVGAPVGGKVMQNGDVYICQRQNGRNPSPRITILNGAFFVDREILFDDIPEAAGFVPGQVAVSKEGLIYIAGVNHRGVMVLDQEGSFLRMLQPQDLVSARMLARAGLLSEEEEEEDDSQWDHIPEEFRPRKQKDRLNEDIQGPVIVNALAISASGRIYLLSSETGKIYVYGKDEGFLFSFGKKGGSPGQMSLPKDLAIDDERQILYVPDYMRHTVLVYDLEGTYLFELGGRGTEPGWFNFPVGVAITRQKHLIVADLFNQRVQVLEVGYEDVLPFLRNRKTAGSEDSDQESGLMTIPEVEMLVEKITEGGTEQTPEEGESEGMGSDEIPEEDILEFKN